MRQGGYILMAMLPLLLVGATWSGEVDCARLPANSISRQECERSVKKLAEPKLKQSEELSTTNRAIQECGPRPPQTTAASPYAERQAETAWKDCVTSRFENIRKEKETEVRREAAERAEQESAAAKNRKWVCRERRGFFRSESTTTCEYE